MRSISVDIFLDIDDSLADLLGHIVQDMTRRFGNPEKLTRAEVRRKYGYVHRVPHWQSAEAREYVGRVFDDPALYARVQPFPGAREAVRAIHRMRPIRSYVSYRPHMVHDETVEWLRREDFPEAPVVVRPRELSLDTEGGAEWKVRRLEELQRKNVPSFLVDDNGNLLEFIPGSSYTGMIFLLGEQTEKAMAMAQSLDGRVVLCPTWSDVCSRFLQRFGL